MPAPVKGSRAILVMFWLGELNLALWQSVRYENVPLDKLKSVSLNKIIAEEKSVDK